MQYYLVNAKLHVLDNSFNKCIHNFVIKEHITKTIVNIKSMAEFSNRIYVPTYKCIYKLQTGAPTLNTCPFFLWGGGVVCQKCFHKNT